MVMGGDSSSKVVGSNPGAGYWMDMTFFFTLICCKNCIVCLKRPKINKKEADVGPFFKKKNFIFKWTIPSFLVYFCFPGIGSQCHKHI